MTIFLEVSKQAKVGSNMKCLALTQNHVFKNVVRNHLIIKAIFQDLQIKHSFLVGKQNTEF